jgi:hypothetical protein
MPGCLLVGGRGWHGGVGVFITERESVYIRTQVGDADGPHVWAIGWFAFGIWES